MKAKTLVLLLLCFVNFILTAQPENELKISLLTCSSGTEVHSAFGHSSIRVIDSITGQDIAFDYGVFSFDEPNFVWRFLRGELDYKLAARSFNKFKRNYKFKGRGVIEEPLNLSQQDKETLYRFLQNNLKPENRFYRYEFIYDNCSTRIRDITELLPHIKNPRNAELLNLTFRG